MKRTAANGAANGAAAKAGGARSRVPTLRTERSMLREGCRLVAGMDEVGRGALAGPVSVGVVVVHEGTRTAPSGVRDSKLLTPAARQALVPRLRRWAAAFAVGHAQPEEIDRYGIIAALRLAGHRALLALPELPDAVLLDGSHDWLTPPVVLPGTRPDDDLALTQELLFDVQPIVLEPVVLEPVMVREPAPLPELGRRPVVSTMVKADLRCAAVAAASVLAKVERDAMMVERSRLYPGYGWHENKGYAAPEHSAALRELGTCEQHRRSWNLALGEPQPVDVGG